MSMVNCASCGAESRESETYYNDDGEQVCMECYGHAEVAGAFSKAYRNLAYSGLSLALLSACFNPFFIISLLAIGTSFSAVMYPYRLDPEDRAAVSQMNIEMVAAILGLLIALGLTGLRLLGTVAQVALF